MTFFVLGFLFASLVSITIFTSLFASPNEFAEFIRWRRKLRTLIEREYASADEAIDRQVHTL